MSKTISIVVLLSLVVVALLSWFLFPRKVSEKDYIHILVKNGTLYKDLEKSNLNVGFMKDVPQRGDVALVVNCSDEDTFHQAVEIGRKYETYEGLELQILSHDKNYTKRGKIEDTLKVNVPKELEKEYR